MVHGEATGARAFGEEDLLRDIRVKGELERHGSREHLTGVRNGRCSWSRCHTGILEATCDMYWGDTDVVEEQMPEPSLTDGVVTLRPLATKDAPAWLEGEDEEQRRWFEAPRPSQLSDVEQFIADCQESWRTMGNHRHWGIWSRDPDVLVGGIDLRALGNDEVNLSYLVFPGASATRLRSSSGTTRCAVRQHVNECPDRHHQDADGERKVTQPCSRPWGSVRW